MKKFLAIYLGPVDNEAMKKWKSLEPTVQKEMEKTGISAWKNWADENKNSLPDGGSPIGKTKRINAKGISDTKNTITGYSIVEAENQEEAAKLFLNHPHFAIFPGDSVEVMECLQIPGM